MKGPTIKLGAERPKGVSYLLQYRFGRDFQAAGGLPGAPSRPPSEEERAYLAELDAKTPAEISAIVAQVDAERAAERDRTHPYNVASAMADVAHWARADIWTMHEAVTLSLGRDPRCVSHKGVMKYAEVAFMTEYQERFDLISRAHLPSRAPPSVYLRWRRAKMRDAPTNLLEAIARFSPPPSEKPPLSEAIAEPTLGDTERQTFLKIILGMAIEQYGYEPGAARNKAVSAIREDLAGVGLDVTDDTIRAKLKDAVDRVLPGDWRSRKS